MTHQHLEYIQALEESVGEMKRAFLREDGWTEGPENIWRKGDQSLLTDDEAFMTYERCPCER